MADFDETIHDDIDRYLRGEMTGDEKRRFEAAIAGDPLLKEEVTFQRTLSDAVKHARRTELKEYIRSNAAASGSMAAANRLLRVAAIALLVMGVGIFMYVRSRHDASPLASANQDQKVYPPTKQGPIGDTINKPLADNNFINPVQPPPMPPRRKEEDKRKYPRPEAPQEKEIDIAANSPSQESEMKVYKDAIPDAKAFTPTYDTVVYVKVISEEDKLKRFSAGGADRKVTVEFFPSADITGYRFFNRKLNLYGVQAGTAEVVELDSQLYLKLNGKAYAITEQAYAPKATSAPLTALVAVTDKKLLRRLK